MDCMRCKKEGHGYRFGLFDVDGPDLGQCLRSFELSLCDQCRQALLDEMDTGDLALRISPGGISFFRYAKSEGVCRECGRPMLGNLGYCEDCYVRLLDRRRHRASQQPVSEHSENDQAGSSECNSLFPEG